MLVRKVTHANLLKMLDVTQALKHFEKRFDKSIYQIETEDTAKYFTHFMEKNASLISYIDLVLMGYDALVTGVCDIENDVLAYRPDIKAYLENKEAVDEFIAKLEKEKQEGAHE